MGAVDFGAEERRPGDVAAFVGAGLDFGRASRGGLRLRLGLRGGMMDAALLQGGGDAGGVWVVEVLMEGYFGQV